HAERGAARFRAREREEDAPDVEVELHDDALLERVIHAPQEREFLPVLLERLLEASLQLERHAEAHVRADDEDTLAARQAALLERDGAARGAVGAREIAQERRDVRELEREPAALRVPLERALERGGRLRELRAADEESAAERRVRRAVLGVHLESA